MADETIEVRYKYTGISSADDPSIKMYHKYIIYTDSNGTEYYARGGTTAKTQGLTAIGPTHPLGLVDTIYGEYLPNTYDYIDPQEGYHPSEPIATGSDLSVEWAKIVEAMDYIKGSEVPYTLGRNSNSAVDGALQYAGLPTPTQDGRDGPHWAPGETPVPLPPEPYDDPVPVPQDPPVPDSCPVPEDWFPPLNDGMGQAPLIWSPLVIDMDGDGIELTNLNGGAVYWDIDSDGFAEASAWVGPDDALLAIDLNEDGIINNHSELFGTQTVDGFTKLTELDSNNDGIISALDAEFANLKISRDLNQDAEVMK